jgi:protoporphyrin/coproporphyrin ferrochelatase
VPTSSRDAAPIGILLFNLGGPDSLADVEPFLINLFSDRDIIELPLGAVLQPIVARIIAKSRGPSVRENYARIGGGSPQLRITREQARALETRLNDGGLRARTFIAMRYWQPTTEQALEAMAAEGISRVVTLTLFPHYSQATTGSSEKELQRVLAQPKWRGRFTVTGIRSYPDDPLYLDAMTDAARRTLDGFPAAVRDHVVLLFSAHGLPQKFIDEGDPYVDEIQATRLGILERLPFTAREVLAYQSRTGPVKWIGPGTEEMLETLGHEGVKNVLVVPLSFVSDHIETLYEVDMLFAGVARKAGITGYWRTDALNSSPRFIEALSGLVEDHLERRNATECGGCGCCASKPIEVADAVGAGR